MKKLSLEIEALAVDSFATTREAAGVGGTVRGHAIVDPQPTPPDYAVNNCTCAASCPCPTAAYHCATVRLTAISCTYTQNVSCFYNTTVEGI